MFKEKVNARTDARRDGRPDGRTHGRTTDHDKLAGLRPVELKTTITIARDVYKSEGKVWVPFLSTRYMAICCMARVNKAKDDDWIPF